VEALRARQVRNFLAVTLLSAGIPMIHMGDEMRRTQHGNSNAFCQDNEISWLDWGLVERHVDLRRFVRKLVALRLAFDPSAEYEERPLAEFLDLSRIEWHGVRLGAPDWSAESRSLAVCFAAPGRGGRVYCAYNAYWEPLTFELPPVEKEWRLLVDTARAPPGDAHVWGVAPVVGDHEYRVEARSVVVLGSRG
jgi:glycogen operon protein